jgi:hypothetical protein
VAITLKNRTLRPAVQLFIEHARGVTTEMRIAGEAFAPANKRAHSPGR